MEATDNARGYKRILQLIEWLAQQAQPVALADAVNHFAWPKSTALLLIRALVEDGYVQRQEDGRYRLVRLPGEPGPGRLAWGTLVRVCESVLRDAVAAVNETGFIAVLTPERQLRYLTKILPEREIRYDRNIDRLRVAHHVASGLVLLAHLGPAELDAYLQAIAREGEDDPAAIGERVAAARKDGYAINLDGRVEGAAGVAAPILDSRGHAVAAVNIAGPRQRLAENLDQVVEAAMRAAAEASHKLRFSVPS